MSRDQYISNIWKNRIFDYCTKEGLNLIILELSNSIRNEVNNLLKPDAIPADDLGGNTNRPKEKNEP